MRHEIVVMTKSKKGNDGFCVAGIDAKTGEWIRLNVPGEYSFPRTSFCYKDGKEVCVLDAISIDLTGKDDRFKNQPENFFCNPKSIEHSHTPIEGIITNRINTDKNNKYIFYNNGNHLESTLLDSHKGPFYSLIVVEPDKLAIKRNESGKLIATFEYAGNMYKNIRVTDIKMNQSANFPIGKTLYANTQHLLVLSLGEKFFNPSSEKSENWKFVAAIIDKKDIEKQWVIKTTEKEENKDVHVLEGIDVKEVIIKAEQVPGSAGFYNYEELKAYIKDGLSLYNNTRYSLENVEQARRDFEVLKAVRKKLTTKRKDLEASYIMPIKEVLKQIDELIDMVKEPYSVIDKMLKDNEKAIKEREIIRYAYNKSESLGEYAVSVVESKAFFNPRWRNISYKEKTWKSDVDSIIATAKRDITYIENAAGEFRPAVLAYYLDHLSMDGVQVFIDNLKKAELHKEPQIPEITQGSTQKETQDTKMILEHSEIEEHSVDNHITNDSESHRYENMVRSATIGLMGSEGDINRYVNAAASYNIQIDTVDIDE